MPADRELLIGILEAMKDGIYIVNPQYGIEYANPALLEQFGPVDGQKCYQYLGDREDVCPGCQNEAVFAGKTVHWEWYSEKNDRTYDVIDTPIRNSDGSLSKLVVFRDITDRVQMEEQLGAR